MRKKITKPMQFRKPMRSLLITRMNLLSLAVLSTVLPSGFAFADRIAPFADKFACAVADIQDAQSPHCLALTGTIGTRIDANVKRLLAVDTERLLEGFRKRPGRQEWDGEHIGKWLHAATLAWVYTGNPELRAKLDRAAAELVKCQLEDGYLGTYLPKDNWTEWDVWVHKYNLLGLIAYMRYTGNVEPLPACRKMADLLCSVFGDTPDRRDILKAGHHAGMAPTSVLEPMVLLYRMTGEPRYRDFCEYILRAWEQPNGPQIVSRLLEGKGVQKVGNGKAYEMLSCVNGMLEWYRTVGEEKYLKAALNAWRDIVEKRLYITGTASYGEHFHDDFDLPNTGNVGETCVTVTWIQFNAQLLRLTGEARFAEQLERTVYNQLPGAQRPNGEDWGYYVQMEGKKPYAGKLAINCCQSSGPRGVALIPTFAATTDADGIVVNLFDAGTANLRLRSGKRVKLKIDSMYPADGKVVISVDPAEAGEFAAKLRIPDWCKNAALKIADEPAKNLVSAVGYVEIKRTWKPGDKIELTLPLETHVILGRHKNAEKIALMYGPLVLAADADLMGVANLGDLPVDSYDARALGLSCRPAPEKFKTWTGALMFILTSAPQEIRLLPFADAGMMGGNYKVWLSAKDAAL
ncbi:MAG: glycoside hydrolase family 127 protein [Pirellulales bacterium]|nr:glycoside hydrolase family 127 protein [Pirellulales bacterium]